MFRFSAFLCSAGYEIKRLVFHHTMAHHCDSFFRSEENLEEASKLLSTEGPHVSVCFAFHAVDNDGIQCGNDQENMSSRASRINLATRLRTMLRP